MSKPVTMALIGAGNRGRGIFGQYALDMPHRAKFVAVVEPDDAKRAQVAQQHGLAEADCHRDIASFFAGPKVADAVVIATLESLREEPVLRAIEKGYHILVEKPLGCSPEQVIRICDAAKAYDGIFMVCHQMRYNSVYSTLKRLIASGDYGDIVAIQHSENLSYSHMAHSFVRGFFNNDAMTPMILAKSCHDMDVLRYYVDAAPKRVSSFGGLTHFKPEKAPAGAPAFCLDGCPAYRECPYHVLKLYFGPDADPAYIRQMGVVKDNRELMELLRTNRFGRCVYRCDNNVVDHMTVQIEFDNDVVVSFAMIGHNYVERRLTKVSLTNGELELDISTGMIRAWRYEPNVAEEHRPSGTSGTHGGGDRIIMDAFVDAIRSGDKAFVLTPVGMSLDGHLLAFAAEEARKTGTVISLADYEQRIRARM